MIAGRGLARLELSSRQEEAFLREHLEQSRQKRRHNPCQEDSDIDSLSDSSSEEQCLTPFACINPVANRSAMRRTCVCRCTSTQIWLSCDRVAFFDARTVGADLNCAASALRDAVLNC